MKICFVALDDIVCEWMVQSLRELPEHETATVWLNHVEPHQLSYQAKLIERVRHTNPDVIVYAGPAGGPYCPQDETFLHLRELAPSIFLCFDASDSGWHAMLDSYYQKDCFDVVVNCDGCDDWPKGPNGMTMWCPVGMTAYSDPPPWSERPIPFGFCGGHRVNPRYHIVTSLARTSSLFVRPREEVYGTYQGYADFLKSCKVVLNICYSAGGPDGQQKMTKQLKARVIETGFAGACLLETRGSPVAQFFTPGEDYLQYETPEEAAAVLRYATPEFLSGLAARFHAKTVEKFHPRQFWGPVLGRLSVSCASSAPPAARDAAS